MGQQIHHLTRSCLAPLVSLDWLLNRLTVMNLASLEHHDGSSKDHRDHITGSQHHTFSSPHHPTRLPYLWHLLTGNQPGDALSIKPKLGLKTQLMRFWVELELSLSNLPPCLTWEGDFRLDFWSQLSTHLSPPCVPVSENNIVTHLSELLPYSGNFFLLPESCPSQSLLPMGRPLSWTPVWILPLSLLCPPKKTHLDPLVLVIDRNCDWRLSFLDTMQPEPPLLPRPLPSINGNPASEAHERS